MITIDVETENGSHLQIKADETERRTLMDLLAFQDLGMLAACGGMALCGTCHVQFVEGAEKLPELDSEEIAMLNSLPDTGPQSRLSCQIMIGRYLDNAVLKIMPAY